MLVSVERGEKTPTPKISALLRKRPVALRAKFVLTKTENGLTTDIFVAKCTGRGLVVKRPGALSKVQMLNLVLGVGVFSLLPIQNLQEIDTVVSRFLVLHDSSNFKDCDVLHELGTATISKIVFWSLEAPHCKDVCAS